jgi:hypothetical protein
VTLEFYGFLDYQKKERTSTTNLVEE